MSKTHTPAPWAVVEKLRAMPDCPEFVIEAVGDGYIATVDSSRAENTENAHLIASAPTFKAERDRAVTLLRVLTGRYVANPGTQFQFVTTITAKKDSDITELWESARAFLKEVDHA